jgi:hypothetical protein
MTSFICTTCGTQYAEGDEPPAACAICQDERQYVKSTGQQWTTLDKLRKSNRNSIRFEEARRIVKAVEPFEYDRVYGAFWDTVIERDGKAAVRRSAERYLRAIRGETQ